MGAPEPASSSASSKLKTAYNNSKAPVVGPISASTLWAVNSSYSNPNFAGCGGGGAGDAKCRMGWVQRISGGSNIII